ncbi:toxin [Subtercola sp. YIM 133946]|uniref:toxin n=1 Tax=Subtercola sp. YIM 133946 TaxID=3118909 RepID=UPI002F935341
MNVHPSALKHRLLATDVVQAATWALWIEDIDDENPARQLRLGFDTRGRLLETVVLVFDSGNELVIHAIKARPHMIDLLPTTLKIV